jgi:hypothetical protein
MMANVTLASQQHNSARDVLDRLHAHCPTHGAEMNRLFEAWLQDMGTDEGQKLLDEYRVLLRQELAFRELQRAKAWKLADPKDRTWQEQNEEAARDEAANRESFGVNVATVKPEN